MQVTICGPNIQFRHGATFEVHADRCLDLKRGMCRHDECPLTMDAASVAELVDACYPTDDFQCESGEFAYDFRFAPCCRRLAREVAA